MTKRRSKGDGGLVQRHDHPTCPPLEMDGGRPKHSCKGRWVGTIDVTIDGRKRRKYIYGRTQAQARAKLDKARGEKAAGTLVVSSMTVEKWLHHWLDSIAARNLKPQTITGYRGYIDHWLVPQMGKRRLTDLRPEHIRALHDTMREDGRSEATVRQAHAILKKSLRDAVFDGKLTVSPGERVKSPKTTTRRRKQLTLEQAWIVLKAAGDDARWWLALYYGLRQGEALGLHWRDVDFEHRTIAVVQTLQYAEDGTPFFGDPKSENSQRVMPLLPVVEARLKVHYLAQGRPDVDSLVFPRSDGGPVKRYADYKAWHRLLDAAAVPPWAPIPRVSLHSARGTAASVLEAAGVSDRLVMQILGHSQVQMTHQYQTADLDRMRAAFEAASRVLELGSGGSARGLMQQPVRPPDLH